MNVKGEVFPVLN